MAAFGSRGTARVVIHKTQLYKQFNPRTGSAAVFLGDQLDRGLAAAQARSRMFSRSYSIYRSHFSSGVLKVGRLHAQGYIYNTSPHALFKHNGTTGPIYPKGKAMSVPVSRGALKTFPVGPTMRKKFVRGQKGEPWLDNAMGVAHKQASISAAIARARQ